jgi:hypothetical protein
MRDENLSLIEANMFLPEDQRKPMTEKQEQLLKQVTDCYNLQLQKPMASRTYLRNYLMKKYKVSKVQAYNIIIYAAVLLGNVQASHKNWVRQRIEFLSEQAYTAADAGNLKKAETLTKIAGVLAKAFQTNLDEGEIINAQKYLDEEPITLTIDPSSALKIKTSEAKQKEIERMLRKYEIEDAEIVTEVEDET